MKIEVLYFSGCPNRVPALELVAEVLGQEGTAAEVVEIEVRNAAAAQKLAFLGSPSIRVDGRDVEPAARGTRASGMVCRTYVDNGKRTGVPPPQWIRAAIREAHSRQHGAC